MCKITLFLWTLACSLIVISADAALAAPSPAHPDAQALLRAADAIRNPDGSFAVTITLQEYRDRKLRATSALTVFSRPAEGSGQYNNLLRFLAPTQDVDKLMLRHGRDLWFFDPASKVSIRISPQARLLGQASNGDVMSVNLAGDYDATWVATEDIPAAAGMPRAAHHLTLRAKRPDVTYPIVDYWVDAESGAPVKAQFRTAEKRLLKTAFFRRFEEILGKSRPTETVIVDGVNPNWVTVMRAAHYRQREVPKAWLHRAFLPRFLSVIE